MMAHARTGSRGLHICCALSKGGLPPAFRTLCLGARCDRSQLMAYQNFLTMKSSGRLAKAQFGCVRRVDICFVYMCVAMWVAQLFLLPH